MEPQKTPRKSLEPQKTPRKVPLSARRRSVAETETTDHARGRPSDLKQRRQTLPASAPAPEEFTTKRAAAWRTAASAVSFRIGEVPKGFRVTERPTLDFAPGWVPVEPRGFLREEDLAPVVVGQESRAFDGASLGAGAGFAGDGVSEGSPVALITFREETLRLREASMSLREQEQASRKELEALQRAREAVKSDLAKLEEQREEAREQLEAEREELQRCRAARAGMKAKLERCKIVVASAVESVDRLYAEQAREAPSVAETTQTPRLSPSLSEPDARLGIAAADAAVSSLLNVWEDDMESDGEREAYKSYSPLVLHSEENELAAPRSAKKASPERVLRLGPERVPLGGLDLNAALAKAS